jgi:hypothetical protein
MVKAADALWDAWGGPDPTVTVASTQRSRRPAPNSGKRGDKRGGNNRPKSRPPFRPDFHSFQNPGNGVCKFHNYYANRANNRTDCKLQSWVQIQQSPQPTVYARPDISADLPGHLTGPVATPHVLYYILYHIFISVLMYTTRTTQITYPNPESYHNLPIP